VTLGSLFDGIGGFPLAAVRLGITPIWASEIDPVCIDITKRHFPNMKHLGDIKNIDGADLEPVDIITFGSPCQDLSLAGKRKGLSGKRSGLFNEAVRIIKEMRQKTNGAYPRRIVWENVPGVFSSNGGEDFRTVLEKIAGIADPGTSIPRPSERVGWLNAGAVVGDSWLLAWRILDAKYFGIPQRRKRIFLVADFGGRGAGEILFKPEILRRNSTECEKNWKDTAKGIRRSIEQRAIDFGGTASRIQMNPEVAVTLQAGGGGGKTGLYCLPYKSFSFQRIGEYKESDISKTLASRDYKSPTDLIVEPTFKIRRLTPKESERLQGFPDGWTEYGYDKKLFSDNQRYKILGNSLAIPCVEFILSGIIDFEKKGMELY
jgi:DNA (cytosine-5)-methyltransferase 1